MPSRIGKIIAFAETTAASLHEGLPQGSKAKSNIEAINGICRALLKRKTPILPTAKLVAEEGLKKNPYFPSERTIFNSYRMALRIWKKAYYDVMNIDADPPVAEHEVERVDTSMMDPSMGNLVDRLKAIIRELTQRCNVLKRLVDESVTVHPYQGQDNVLVEDAMMRLSRWLQMIADSPFQLDEIGLRVGRKTPPGTRIMDRELFDRLGALVGDYERVRRAERATVI